MNLGCPHYHEGWQCVDANPLDRRVIKADAIEYLKARYQMADHIYSKNLLEHLGNPLRFLELCNWALAPGGTLELITDNAWWIPFYLPFWIDRTGIGAHACEAYAENTCSRYAGSPHYMVFSKMHLRNLLRDSGFSPVEMRYTTFFARIYVRALKASEEK